MEEDIHTNNVYTSAASEINIRLKMLVERFTKGSASAFAHSIHLKQQSFDRLLKKNKKNGKFPGVKPEIYDAILKKYPSVQKVWLYTGEGPMLNTIEDPQSPFHISPHSDVPYYRVDFIHEFELIKNKKAEYIGYHVNFQAYNHADFWCHFTGHSMEPEIAAGDFIAMKEIHDKKEGILYGEMYGIVTKNFCTIRRVAKGSSDQRLKLIPSNKSAEYAEQEIPRPAIQKLFLVICCVKNL